MNHRTRNIFSGLTMILALVGLSWMIFIFGEVPAWVSKQYAVQVELENSGGLTRGSRVLLKGLDVGYVESLHLKEDLSQGIDVVIRIESKYKIPKSVQVQVASSLFGSGGALQMTLPKRPTDQPPLTDTDYLSTDGSAKLVGSNVTFSQRLEENLNRRFDKFETLADDVRRLSEEYLKVGQKINQLVEERSLADVDAGKTQANITTVIARADQNMTAMRDAVRAINAILKDEQLIDDLKTTVANARNLTEKADTSMDSITRKYVAVADDVSKTLVQANKLLADAKSGKGTLGKLMQDPALYNSMNDAAGRLDDALKELKLLIQKWKAEGLPVQF